MRFGSAHDRLPQLGQAAKRGIAVGPMLGGDLREPLDHVRRRPDLGIATAEIHGLPRSWAAPATRASRAVKYCGGSRSSRAGRGRTGRFYGADAGFFF